MECIDYRSTCNTNCINGCTSNCTNACVVSCVNSCADTCIGTEQTYQNVMREKEEAKMSIEKEEEWRWWNIFFN
jgi:hypothetical protein